VPWATLALAVALIVILGLSACGSASDPPEPSATAPNNLISQAEADKYPADSAERAFFEYWSALQYQSWAEVASYYDPAFRDFVGTAAVIGGKKINGASYPQLKPAVVKVRPDDGGFTAINYKLQFLDGTKELASAAWREREGSWQIVYDSRLDAELKQFAENQVEYARNGVLPTDPEDVSPQATRAGAAAAQEQARFSQQELEISQP
jgi:hypothetical protein